VPSPTVGRITTRAAFAELQRSRARGTSGPVRAVFVPSVPPLSAPVATPPAATTAGGTPTSDDMFPQVGYAIGKQCGTAVVRNRLRRRAREVVRSEVSHLPRGTYLLRFSPDSASTHPAAFRADVAKAMQRAARQARDQAVRGR
jgi:ribonuclease P protein component